MSEADNAVAVQNQSIRSRRQIGFGSLCHPHLRSLIVSISLLIFHLTGAYAPPPLLYPSALGGSTGPSVNAYNTEFGTFMGYIRPLVTQSNDEEIVGQVGNKIDGGSNSGNVAISGMVYAINESAIQIINFTFDGKTPDTFFWLDRGSQPTRDGVRLSTFEYGLSPLGQYPSVVPPKKDELEHSDEQMRKSLASNELNNGKKTQQQKGQTIKNISATVTGANGKNAPLPVATQLSISNGNSGIRRTPLSPSSPAITSRVVLVLPDEAKLTSFRSLSLYTLADIVEGGQALAIVPIPENLMVPRTQLLQEELRGLRYGLSSGVIQLLDTKTIKIFGFMFQGDKAPDGYFYVGRGTNVSREAGVKAIIRGRDTQERISAMNERYTGGRDIFVELPDSFLIDSIDWLSVYCVRYETDFGHVQLRNISLTVPPYIPPQKSFEDELRTLAPKRWNVSKLVGQPKTQQNFTFQLGPSAGQHGYRAIMRVARPPRYVWYVNGYLAPELYLKRGVNYTFVVEGGRNKTGPPEFYNPLYLSNSSYGGYAKLSNAERQHVRKYLHHEVAGRQCRWEEEELAPPADQCTSFVDYRDLLRLECVDEPLAPPSAAPATGRTNTLAKLDSAAAAAASDDNGHTLLWFMPDKETPATIYYGSYTNYQMGGIIHIVDDFPPDMENMITEPFHYDARQHKARLQQERERNAGFALPFNLSVISLTVSFAIFLFCWNL